MFKKMINFCKDEEGASMVEYGLLVALIAIVAIVGVSLLGTNLNVFYNTAAGHVAS